jgi:hypothetical protein
MLVLASFDPTRKLIDCVLCHAKTRMLINNHTSVCMISVSGQLQNFVGDLTVKVRTKQMILTLRDDSDLAKHLIAVGDFYEPDYNQKEEEWIYKKSIKVSKSSKIVLKNSLAVVSKFSIKETTVEIWLENGSYNEISIEDWYKNIKIIEE